MGVPNKQIGWSQEAILLHGVSQQLQRLLGIISSSGGGGGGTVTGANNGLTLTGTNIQLGGTLIADTSIPGAGKTFALGFLGTPVSTFNVTAGADYSTYSAIAASGSRVLLENYSAGVLKGTLRIGATESVLSAGSFGGLGDTRIIVGLNTGPGTAYFQDNRTGINQTGFEYFADYSANFRPLSFVNKAYVDSISNKSYRAFINITAVTQVLNTSGITITVANVALGQYTITPSVAFTRQPVVTISGQVSGITAQALIYNIDWSGYPTVLTINCGTTGGPGNIVGTIKIEI